MIAHDDMALAQRAKRLQLMGFCLLALLAACTEKSSLTIAEKTRFVSELIAERSECNAYWQKLSVPAKDNKALNDLYEEAKAAHCLKPDV